VAPHAPASLVYHPTHSSLPVHCIALSAQNTTCDDAPHANKHSAFATKVILVRSVAGRIAHFVHVQRSKNVDAAGASFRMLTQIVCVMCSNVRVATRPFVRAAIPKDLTVVRTAGSALCARNASADAVAKKSFTVKIVEKRADWPAPFVTRI